MNKKKKENILSILFILPTIAVFGIFMFWPLIYTFYLSFFKWNMVAPIKELVVFKNYIDVFIDPVTLKIVKNTGVYILILVCLNFALPYVLAFIISFVITKWKGLYKGLLFMPSIISLVVAAIIFSWIFNPISGPLAIILNFFGITLPVWSKTNTLIIFVLSLITSYKAFGYNFIVLMAGVGSVSSELVEAAKLEKASNFKIFTSIVAPLSSSTGIYILIMTIVQGLQYVFTPIKVLTDGGPNDASSNIIFGVYREAFGYFSTGKASALSIITMVFFIILLAVEFKFVEKGVYYEN